MLYVAESFDFTRNIILLIFLQLYESFDYNIKLQPGEDYTRLYRECVGSGLS